MRVGVGGAVVAMCWASVYSTTARAQTERPPAQLVYEPSARTEGCPDETTLRAEIVSRLDADPFSDDADTVVHVTIDRTDTGYTATIRVTRDGEFAGARELDTKRRCATLARAVALAVTLLLPAVVEQPAPAPPVTQADDLDEPAAPPATARPSPEVARVATAVTPSPPAATIIEVSATVGAHVGLLPDPGNSVGAQARLRWSRWSLGAELDWSPPAQTPLAGGELRTSLLSGSVGPCWHRSGWGLCGVGTVGVLRAVGLGYTTNEAATTPYAAAGARVSWEVPLTRYLAARARVDVNATLVRARLRATGSPAGEWSAPPASAATGLSLVGRFR